VMGTTQYSTSQLYAPITISYDVSRMSGAAGIYFEMSRPNQPFSQPNGTQPDMLHTAGFAKAGVKGTIGLVPAQHLPGYGSYFVRVIALDASGRQAVGVFSNTSVLQVTGQRRRVRVLGMSQ